jgi:hypothetical protein
VVIGYSLWWLLRTARPTPRVSPPNVLSAFASGLLVLIVFSILTIPSAFLLYGLFSGALSLVGSPQPPALAWLVCWELARFGLSLPFLVLVTAHALREKSWGLLSLRKATRKVRTSRGYLRAWGLTVVAFTFVEVVTIPLSSATLTRYRLSALLPKGWSPSPFIAAVVDLALFAAACFGAATALGRWAAVSFPEVDRSEDGPLPVEAAGGSV